MTVSHAHQSHAATATGVQLAKRFSSVADSLRAGLIPRSVGSELSKALDKAESRLQRRSSLERLHALLDPHQQQSLWWLACELNTRLERFKDAGLRRVKQGHRPPDAIEQNLLVLIDTGPQSPYRIWLELQDLTLKR